MDLAKYRLLTLGLNISIKWLIYRTNSSITVADCWFNSDVL